MHIIDNFLNNITMYRLVLYSLLSLFAVAVIFGFLGIIPYSGFSILITGLIFKIVTSLTNYVFSKSFGVPANAESSDISALILTLIVTPFQRTEDVPFILWVGVLAISSKYILAYKNKHIFNPVAIALVLTSIGINNSASWWIGTVWMLPFVIVCGILITQKIRRWDLVLTFLVTALISTSVLGILRGGTLLDTIQKNLLYSPLFFFAFVMLTEPLTTPPTRRLRMLYAGLIGLLIPPQVHIGPIYSTPELALVIGNIFSYIISPKEKLMLTLQDKIQIARDTFDFVFTGNGRLHFVPGQYMEWTLGQSKSDSRGNRRYFTIASSPTEELVRIGVKFNTPSSSFKTSLSNLRTGDSILAGQLAGDFTLPHDKTKKFVFIAGGIGITPFRSIIKYLIDKQERRDIVLFYTNKTAQDIAYKDIFSDALSKLGIKTVYVLTDKDSADGWSGETGYLTEEMIKKYVEDYQDRMYYISGSNAMVESYRKLLLGLHVPRIHIITDYFPGF